jgi:hypothetical protein
MVEWVKNQLFKKFGHEICEPFFMREAWLHNAAWQDLCLATKSAYTALALL